MSQPTIWILFGALFVVAGLLNIARGAQLTDERRAARITLGKACFVWAAAALAFRFVSEPAGYGLAALAGAVMIAAAVKGMQRRGE